MVSLAASALLCYRVFMISVICVTKNRPQNVSRLFESLKATSSNYEIIFVVDKGDTTSVPIKDVQILEQEGRVFNDMVNVALPYAKGEYLLIVGDDCVFRTKGWDDRFTLAHQKYSDKISLVFANDLLWTEGQLATHPCITREWADTLGYFTPPYFEVDYGDTWLNELAVRLNRRVFLKDVVIEHMHPCCGKAPRDSVYDHRAQFRGKAHQQWAETKELRQRDYEKLLAKIKGI